MYVGILVAQSHPTHAGSVHHVATSQEESRQAVRPTTFLHMIKRFFNRLM